MNKTNPEIARAIAEITEFFRAAVGPDVSLGARLKFDYGTGGVVFIDGSRTPNEVHNRNEKADCTVEIDPLVHLKILRLELDQTTAFMQGKMKISGDVAVAVRLRPLILRRADRAAS